MPAGMASAGSSSLTTTLTEGRRGSCEARGSQEGERECEMAEFAMAQFPPADTAASATPQPASESSEARGASRARTATSISNKKAQIGPLSPKTAARAYLYEVGKRGRLGLLR